MDINLSRLPSAQGRELARKFLDFPPSEDDETILALMFDDALQRGFDDCRRAMGKNNQDLNEKTILRMLTPPKLLPDNP